MAGEEKTGEPRQNVSEFDYDRYRQVQAVKPVIVLR